jgi:hypothetical protein
MVNECQRGRKLINYNSFHQVNFNSDNKRVDRAVSTHTHIMQCKSKSHQQFLINKGLLVYHQNVCGLVNKTNEIVTSHIMLYRTPLKTDAHKPYIYRKL